MTPRLCQEHGLMEPCGGCRADELAARGEQAAALVAGQNVPRERVHQILRDHGAGRVPDARSAAAGEREDDDG